MGIGKASTRQNSSPSSVKATVMRLAACPFRWSRPANSCNCPEMMNNSGSSMAGSCEAGRQLIQTARNGGQPRFEDVGGIVELFADRIFRLRRADIENGIGLADRQFEQSASFGTEAFYQPDCWQRRQFSQ